MADRPFRGRIEDRRLVRGLGRFADDIAFDGLAHAVVLRSIHVHARITGIDAAAARAAPGVRAVLTGADYVARGLGTLPCDMLRKRRDGSDMVVPPRTALAVDTVRFLGEAVALVVAESRAQALEAAELVDVDYDPLPAVTDTAAAALPGAPAVWPDCPDNVAFSAAVGDRAATERAFARAAHVVEQRLVVTRVGAHPIEPRACVARFDSDTGRYTLHVGVHTPLAARRHLAEHVLKVPAELVRVIVPDIGGSFGLRGGTFVEYALALWAAEAVGRPVKWLGDRSDAFLSDEQARDSVTDAALALDDDGKALALRARTIANVGAYVVNRGTVAPATHIAATVGVYAVPHAYVEVDAVYSHTNPTAPYRGAGRPEAAYIVERLMDKAARRLDLDPAELRRRNYIPERAMPYRQALGLTYDSGAFARNMERALEAADYAGFAVRRARSRARGRLRGIGLSNTVETAGTPGPTPERCRLHLDADGRLAVLLGSTAHGQGHETMFGEMIAARLGVAPEDVTLVTGDTERVPFGGGTYGSRTATLMGSALAGAVDELIEIAKTRAADLLEAGVADLEFAAGAVRVAGTDRAVSLREIAAAPDAAGAGGLEAEHAHAGDVPNYPNGAHVCEVEIDPETGGLAVLRYVVVDDVGTVLNPTMLKGQIHGGVAQGLGQAVMEAIRFDADSGQLLTGSFMDYGMPRAADLSAIAVHSNPVPTPTNPLGVKGAGEAGVVGSLPAVMNAVENALAAVGVRHIDMPATPERIWRAVRDAARTPPGDGS